MLIPWHQIEIKRLLKVCGLGETRKKTRNTIACKITLKTLLRRLIFSSSFVFDMSFETGITMSQSRRHIRTVTNTWHKKVRQKQNQRLQALAAKAKSSTFNDPWVGRVIVFGLWVVAGLSRDLAPLRPDRDCAWLGNETTEDRMRTIPLTMKATEAAGQWN